MDREEQPKRITQKRLVRMFKDIKRLSSEESRFCFLIGAGASKSSGIKTGWELSEIWYNDLKEDLESDDLSKWEKEISFDKEKIGEFYPALYKKRYEISPQIGYDEFTKMMEYIEPGLGYVILSQVLSSEKHNFVITTNFDYLIEDAVRMYTSTKPFIAGHETLAEFISSKTERPTIIKVHRDLFLHPFNGGDETEILKKEWERALAPILKNFNLLVIGYGGNDGSLMHYLKQIEPESRKEIYWCKRPKDKLNEKVVNLLTEKDFVVEIVGFDELMYALYNALDYNIFEKLDNPDNHPFVESARKRISGLNKKMINLLENLQKNEEKVTNDTKKILKGPYNILLDAFLEEDSDKREAIFLKGIKQYPEDGDINLQYAVFLSDKRKKYDLAKKYYEKAIELSPKNAIYLGSYASFLDNVLMDFDAAEKLYKKAIDFDPNNPGNNVNYANFLVFIRKDYTLARGYYEKAKKMDPNNDIILENYALYLSDFCADYYGAETYYNQILNAETKNTNLLANYAHHIILTKEDFVTAEIYLDKAFQNLNPDNLTVSVELWFYRYAHYKEWYKKGEKELKKLISKGAKSIGWNLNPHVEIAQKQDHPDIIKLKEFAKQITDLPE